MADVLSTTLQFTLSGSWVDSQDLSTVTDAIALNLDDQFSDGTGLDQADIMWHDERTLAATSETLDVTALTRTILGSTNTVNFARIKGLVIRNTTTTAGSKLTVGAAASNAWTGWTSVAASTLYVDPNGILFLWAPSATSWVTSGSSKNIKIDAGANTIVYRIVIIGASA